MKSERTKRPLRLAFPIACALAVGLSLLTGCQRPPVEDTNPLELKAYDVPKGMVRPLLTTFKDVFWLNDKTPPTGRATASPDGRLMVLAPHNVQLGVQTLVDEASKHPLLGDPVIELRYWVVLGRPSASPGPNPPALREVQSALEEITKSLGPQTFSVVATERLTSLHDEWGKEDGPDLHIEQKAVQTVDGVYADLEIKYGKSDQVSTRMRIAPDETVVLGATGQHEANADAGAGDVATLYYLVRLAPRPDGPKP